MTTATLRPDGTYLAGAVVLTGGATLHAVLSDNSDASYGSIVSGDEAVVQLGTVALPAGAVTKTATLRLRCADLVGSSAGIALRLLNGATILHTGSFVPSGSIATLVDAPFAVTLTQTEVDGLRVDILNGVVDTCRLYELYVDLVYATAPVVGVALPTGAQSTPTPQAAWSYTPGSDGGVQSRYQIRVFTLAQYSIGGFDPGVSPATYDSGVVLGSSVYATLGVLPNSSTMRAYINVAQTINGVPQWSGYSFSAFTTSFTTSDIVGLSVFDNGNAGLTITATRNTGTPLWTLIDVQRSDDGGVTWDYIRGGKSFPAPAGATQVFLDYETGNSANAYYRARATYVASGVTIVGAWFGPAGPVGWVSPFDYLKDVHYTARNRRVRIQMQPNVVRPRPQGVNAVISRRDRVVISDIRGLTAGVVSFKTNTDAEAVDLLTLLDNDVLLLQCPPANRWGSKYIAIADVQETMLGAPEIGSEPVRLFTVAFTEVVKPIDTGIV